MAPFRGRGAARGSARGRGRGSTTSRHSRGGFAIRGGNKSTFTTSRLEAQNEGDSDGSDDKNTPSEPDRIEVSGDDSSDDEISNAVVPPYSALLQSLVTTQATDGPHRKRRRIEIEARSGSGNLEPKGPEIINQYVDQVDEPEEDLQVPAEDEEADDTAQDEDASDLFEFHFANPDDNDLSRKLQAAMKGKWVKIRLLYDGVQASELAHPDCDTSQPVGHHAWPNLKNLKLKRRLLGSVRNLMSDLSNVEQVVMPYISSYEDILFCHQSAKNAESLRRLTCLHALNHIFKTRDRVIKDNARLAKDNGTEELDFRDQGFTRPKVLMLLPTRHSCVRAVETIVTLSQPEQEENKKRFKDSFWADENQFSDDKPVDFRELFGGNNDDMFRLGMKFTRKTVKYYSQFYNSDIIFASPLGLRKAIESDDKKKQDYDFLSSIELVIVDQADAILMQNWEHVLYIFEHLNLQPKEAHGCDFSRVRTWYLDNNAKFLRQTIILSAFNTPELNSLYATHMRNIAGKVRFTPDYQGEMFHLPNQVKQIFSRYDSLSLESDPDVRFKYFTTAVLPSLTRHNKPASSSGGLGVLLFIPSYHDFVRLRNFFATSTITSNISFGSISEYTSVREVARARSHFLSGRHSLLLYTERAHHFRRYNIRGVKEIIMYGLPDNPIFYRELVGGFLDKSVSQGLVHAGNTKVRTIFSKWDILKLERIVGREKSRDILGNKGGDTFEFV